MRAFHHFQKNKEPINDSEYLTIRLPSASTVMSGGFILFGGVGIAERVTQGLAPWLLVVFVSAALLEIYLVWKKPNASVLSREVHFFKNFALICLLFYILV